MLLLLACDASSPPCSALEGAVERDLCRYEELRARPPDTAAAAAVMLAQLEDPVVRSAATLGWLRDHPKAQGPEAERLCELLQGTERRSCERRATSPHLHR